MTNKRKQIIKQVEQEVNDISKELYDKSKTGDNREVELIAIIHTAEAILKKRIMYHNNDAKDIAETACDILEFLKKDLTKNIINEREKESIKEVKTNE